MSWVPKSISGTEGLVKSNVDVSNIEVSNIEVSNVEVSNLQVSIDLWMLSEPPVVGFVGGESGAVNPGLLSGADADHLAVLRQADRVALSVFQRDQRHENVSLRLGAQRL